MTNVFPFILFNYNFIVGQLVQATTVKVRDHGLHFHIIFEIGGFIDFEPGLNWMSEDLVFSLVLLDGKLREIHLKRNK